LAAAGSDWGTSISTSLALQYPRRLIGIHLVPPLAPVNPESSEELTDAERAALAELDERTMDGSVSLSLPVTPRRRENDRRVACRRRFVS
jgi:pimeloyl-ACP methyl ester carboxylesterase